MTNQNHFPKPLASTASLQTRMLIGGLVALAVISFFVFGVDYQKPEWGTLWRIRPLIVTPLAGAIGGACFYFIDRFGSYRGWNKAAIYLLSFIVFFIGLWMGVILGLAGTMWN